MIIEGISKYDQRFRLNIKHKISVILGNSSDKKTYIANILTDKIDKKKLNIYNYVTEDEPMIIEFNNQDLINAYNSALYDIIEEDNLILKELLISITLNEKDLKSLPNNKILINLLKRKKIFKSLTNEDFLKLVKYFIPKIEDYWSKKLFYFNSNIIISDDLEILKSNEFSRFANSLKETYFILIIRDKLDNLSYSVDAIYEIRKDINGEYINIPKYTLKYTKDLNQEYKGIEDEGSGKVFFNNLMNTTLLSFKNKNNITNTLIKEKIKYSSLLCIADVCALGSEICKLHQYCVTNKIDLQFLENYKSFEYLLLKSNMFNNDYNIDLDIEEVLNYPNVENMYEYIIKQITKEQKYSYNKSKDLKICYYKPCICLNTKECNKFVKTNNKIEYLFKDTIFDYLITSKTNTSNEIETNIF